MNKFLSIFILHFLCLLVYNNTSCQTIDDSTFYNKATNNLKDIYFSTLKENALVYNGYEYEYFGRGAIGSPFFLVDSMHKGSVFYDGYLYEGVPIRYDIVNDVLLVKYPRDNNTIRLIKNKVDYFSLLDHQFLRLDEAALNKGEQYGFYELLHRDDKVLVFAKRSKKYMLSSNPEDRTASFVSINQYFIYKDEKYTVIDSENDLVKIFRDKEKEIKKFIRTSAVKYKKNAEKAILATALFYHGLTK